MQPMHNFSRNGFKFVPCGSGFDSAIQSIGNESVSETSFIINEDLASNALPATQQPM